MYSLKIQQQNPIATLSEFFRNLLTWSVVDALLVPQEVNNRVAHTLVTRPEGIVVVNPFAPVVYLNAARLVSELTNQERKIGVVLRSCEIRALVELVKLNQAELSHLLIIGIDCLGAFEPATYQELLTAGNFNLTAWLKKAAFSGEVNYNGSEIRRACSICDKITAEHTHLSIGWIGVDPLQELVIEGEYELPMDKLGLSHMDSLSGRGKLIGELKAKKMAHRKTLLAEFSRQINSPGALARKLATCIRCYNCRAVCPLCICQECIFLSPLFKHEAEKYLEQADWKPFVKMPADTLLFHLTRLTHVGLSCVGCGHCESACPSRLPLSLLFNAVGQKIQEVFDYVPGRNTEEKLPLVTYKLTELEPQ